MTGAVPQGLGVAGENFRAEGQGHVHAEVKDIWAVRSGGKVVRQHIVPQHPGQIARQVAGDLGGAVGLGGGQFGATWAAGLRHRS